MTRSALALIGAALLVASCKATTSLPVDNEVFDLRMSADELVCHVKNIAEDQHLSFHYGISEQPFGTMATFRLIGDKFELILLNDQRPFTYELGAYDLSDQGEARTRAKRAFAAFRTALMRRPKGECRS